MDLLQLRYFQTVARLEHITKAAEELHISQPSLSKTINTLEKELGVELFDHRGKYISLNENGRIFLSHVNEIFDTLEDAVKELKDLSGKEYGIIKLLVLSGSKFLPDYLYEFSKLHPHIKFDLVQHVPSLFSATDFDICISSSAHKPSKHNCLPLLTEEILLAIPSGHALSDKDVISLRDVRNENFLSLYQGQTLRKITDSYCKYAGFKPNIVFESDDPATLRGLIKAGMGIAFLPSITWGDSGNIPMKLIHIKEPSCKRVLYLYWPENRYLSNESKLFIDFIKKYFDKYKDQKPETTPDL